MLVTESDRPSVTRSGRSTPAACDVLAGEVLPAGRRGDAAERVLVGAGESSTCAAFAAAISDG
jgi:hypothetical protein